MNESHFNKKIGAQITSARKEMGYSQDELADLVGLTRAYVIEIEKGRNTANYYRMSLLFNLLGIPLPNPTVSEIRKAKGKIKSKIKSLAEKERKLSQIIENK